MGKVEELGKRGQLSTNIRTSAQPQDGAVSHEGMNDLNGVMAQRNPFSDSRSWCDRDCHPGSHRILGWRAGLCLRDWCESRDVPGDSLIHVRCSTQYAPLVRLSPTAD